jgi:hypothetical protein
MKYRTVDVDLEDGKVRPRGSETLPSRARALLTIGEPIEVPDPEPGWPSLAERVRHLEGIGRGEYTDLSTNKAHLADLGQ